MRCSSPPLDYTYAICISAIYFSVIISPATTSMLLYISLNPPHLHLSEMHLY